MGVKGAERSVFDLAHSDPGAAADDATRALAEHALDDAARTQLLWIRGLARREMGLLTEARSDLELAMVLADERALEAQIAVTLSLVLMYIGDTPGALELLDGNEDHLEGADRARLVLQRALLHHRLGRLGEADSGYRCGARRAGCVR